MSMKALETGRGRQAEEDEDLERDSHLSEGSVFSQVCEYPQNEKNLVLATKSFLYNSMS